MSSNAYKTRRGELETYFDRTASDAWIKITSEAPVGSVRATVRAGRDKMRAILLSYLPEDMTGLRVLDAGCGTGSLAVEAAKRGAHVVAIDLSKTLIETAKQRLPSEIGAGRIDFCVGDYADPALGEFDHVVAMDSLIHYKKNDIVRTLNGLAERTRGSMVFTFAPLTPAFALLWLVGKAFPRGDRSPAIEPVSVVGLSKAIEANIGLADWKIARTERVTTSFYKSQALELVCRPDCAV